MTKDLHKMFFHLKLLVSKSLFSQKCFVYFKQHVDCRLPPILSLALDCDNLIVLQTINPQFTEQNICAQRFKNKLQLSSSLQVQNISSLVHHY